MNRVMKILVAATVLGSVCLTGSPAVAAIGGSTVVSPPPPGCFVRLTSNPIPQGSGATGGCLTGSFRLGVFCHYFSTDLIPPPGDQFLTSPITRAPNLATVNCGASRSVFSSVLDATVIQVT